MSGHTYTDEAHAINARNVQFDWDGVPLHYLPGEPVATQFFNFMHIVLPEGERAMAQALADALPHIEDERLREEVVGFIGQEAMHASSHEGVREHLERNGVPVQPVIERISFLIDGMLGDHGLTGRAKKEWLKERLGIFAAMEHFTAFIGQWFLENDRIEDMHPMMLDLIRWHGAEEVEHRSVVYDVFQYMGGKYPMRVASWLVALAFLYTGLIGGTIYISRQDKSIGRKVTLPWLIRGYRKSAKAGHIPPIFRLLLAEAPVYLKPGHHPSTICSTQQAIDYLLRSPAAISAGYTPY